MVIIFKDKYLKSFYNCNPNSFNEIRYYKTGWYHLFSPFINFRDTYLAGNDPTKNQVALKVSCKL